MSGARASSPKRRNNAPKFMAKAKRCVVCNAFASKGCSLTKCRRCCGRDGAPCAMHLEEIQSTKL